MDHILDVYAGEDGFTEVEKDLLLDYLKRIKSQIEAIEIKEEEIVPITITVAASANPKGNESQQPKAVEQAVNVVPAVVEAKIEPIVEPVPERVSEPKVEQPTQPSVEAKLESEKSTFFVQPAESYPQLFDQLNASDLSQKLTLTPIKDVRASLGLNEKIVIKNELFRGDQEKMESVITVLESMPNFQEAKMYMSKNIIEQYQWLSTEKKEHVDKFIKLIYRRFL